MYLGFPESGMQYRLRESKIEEEEDRADTTTQHSPLKNSLRSGRMNSMLRLNLAHQAAELGDSLHFNSTIDSGIPEMRRIDGVTSEERREREYERIRRMEALSKRRGSGASPSKVKVSGGMARKPNAVIKKLKEKELLKESANSSLRMSILSNKLNTSIVSRRGSNAQQPENLMFSPAGEVGGSGSYVGSGAKHTRAGTGAGGRSVSKTTLRTSSSKKDAPLEKTGSLVSEFSRMKKQASQRKPQGCIRR